MPIEIEEYKKQLEHHPTPYLTKSFEDPLPGKQTVGNFYDVHVVAINTLKGIEVYATQTGRGLAGHIEPDRNDIIEFTQSHSVIFISKR